MEAPSIKEANSMEIAYTVSNLSVTPFDSNATLTCLSNWGWGGYVSQRKGHCFHTAPPPPPPPPAQVEFVNNTYKYLSLDLTVALEEQC